MGQDSKAAVSAVRGILESAVHNLTWGQSESWCSLYAESCVFHLSAEPAVRGRDSLVAWGKRFPVESMSWDDYNINVYCDLAWGTEGKGEPSVKRSMKRSLSSAL